MLTQSTARGLPAIRPRAARRPVCLRKVAAHRDVTEAEPAVDFKTTAALFTLTALALEQPAFAAPVADSEQIVQSVQSAQAPSSDAVDSAIASVIDAVKNGGDLAKSAISALGRGVDTLYQGYKTAAPYLEDTYRKAEPTLKQGVDVAGKVANEAAKVAQPILKRGVEQAEEIIGQLEQSTGVTSQSLEPVVSTAKATTGQALTVATPWFERFVTFVTTAEPLTLGQYAIALVLLYYSAPWLLRGFVGSLRGYSGDVTPAAALDLADKDGNAYIVDIRSQKDKEQLGVPDIASRNKVVDINYAEVDRKVRGQLRDADNIEAKTTALQVAGYKRLSRGNVLLLLDKYGNQSKAVAKELARLGFGKAYIISGGFEGRNGWVQSKLQIRGFTAPARGAGALGTLLSSGTINTRGLAGKK